MVNDRQPHRITVAHIAPGPRCISTEQDAIEAYGENSDLHLFVREWSRRPVSPAVILTPSPGAVELDWLQPADNPLADLCRAVSAAEDAACRTFPPETIGEAGAHQLIQIADYLRRRRRTSREG